MTQKNYLNKDQIKEVTPHINAFCIKEFKEALKEVREGQEYQQHMEDFLSTDEYDKLMISITNGKDPVKQIVSIVESMVDIAYNEEEDFSRFVRNVLCSRIISTNYNLWISTYDEFDSEDYLDAVADIVDKEISAKVEKTQKEYTESILKMRTSMYTWDVPKKVGAVLATTQCGSIDEIEQSILNNIDFEAIVLKNA